MCMFQIFHTYIFIYLNVKIKYSNQGHMLCIIYGNIIQFHNHNDYDQSTFGEINGKKVSIIYLSLLNK